jgi:hypothetical protein
MSLAELLGHRFGDRKNSARSIHGDESRLGPAFAALAGGLVAAAACRGDENEASDGGPCGNSIDHAVTVPNGNFANISDVLIRCKPNRCDNGAVDAETRV